MFNLYKNIQELCEERGETISGMSVAIGMSKSTLSNLKNGRSDTISMKTAQKIADYLGVDVDVVLRGKEKQPPVTDDEELWELRQLLHDRPGMKVMFDISKNASPERFKKMLAMMQLMGEDDTVD